MELRAGSHDSMTLNEKRRLKVTVPACTIYEIFCDSMTLNEKRRLKVYFFLFFLKVLFRRFNDS